MRLLVSSKDEVEALESVAGGADIIDVKNPAEGSLGASFPWIIRRVRQVVPKKIEASATIGDVPNLPGTVSLAAMGAAACGADYVKVGLLGPHTLEDAVNMMSCVARSLRDLYPSVKIVAAAYADWKRANTIDPLLIPEVARRSGSHVAMIDTKIKDGKKLFDFLSRSRLSLFVQKSHEHGKLAALAGSIQKEDVRTVASLGTDVIGVRSAVCEGGDRLNGRISRAKVRELSDLIKTYSANPNLHDEESTTEVLVK